jgi:hypothetical protein
MTGITNVKLFAMCNKPGLKRCTRYEAIYYCGIECQTTDWPVHKILCKTFTTTFKATQHPSSAHVRGICFAEGEEQPRMIWLHTRKDENGEFCIETTAIATQPRVAIQKRAS